VSQRYPKIAFKKKCRHTSKVSINTAISYGRSLVGISPRNRFPSKPLVHRISHIRSGPNRTRVYIVRSVKKRAVFTTRRAKITSRVQTGTPPVRSAYKQNTQTLFTISGERVARPEFTSRIVCVGNCPAARQRLCISGPDGHRDVRVVRENK